MSNKLVKRRDAKRDDASSASDDEAPQPKKRVKRSPATVEEVPSDAETTTPGDPPQVTDGAPVVVQEEGDLQPAASLAPLVVAAAAENKSRVPVTAAALKQKGKTFVAPFGGGNLAALVAGPPLATRRGAGSSSTSSSSSSSSSSRQ